MKGITLHKISPDKLTADDYDDIVRFHQSIFSISPELVKSALEAKSVVHVYRNTLTNKLIGTVAFHWSHINNQVIMYIGSVVIDPHYQKAGLFTHSLMSTILYTYMRFPFKKKAAIAFSTTAQAYQYFSILHEYWPRADQPTPDSVIKLIKHFMDVNNTKYEIKEGVLINNETLNKISERNPAMIENKAIRDYFNKANPQASKGAQLVCIVPFNINNFSHVIWKLALKSKFRTISHVYVKYRNYILSSVFAITALVATEIFVGFESLIPIF